MSNVIYKVTEDEKSVTATIQKGFYKELSIKPYHLGLPVQCVVSQERDFRKSVSYFLEKVDIPDTVIYLEPRLFNLCSNLKEVRLSSNLEEINSFVFKGCYKLPEIVLPPKITYIAESAFEGCHSLKKIQFPHNLTEIGNQAFAFCDLHEVILPPLIETIGVDSFAFNYNLKNIVLPENLKEIPKKAFHLNNCDVIHIPKKCTTIGRYALTSMRPFDIIVKQPTLVIEEQLLYERPFGTPTFFQPESQHLNIICENFYVQDLLSPNFDDSFLDPIHGRVNLVGTKMFSFNDTEQRQWEGLL